MVHRGPEVDDPSAAGVAEAAGATKGEDPLGLRDVAAGVESRARGGEEPQRERLGGTHLDGAPAVAGAEVEEDRNVERARFGLEGLGMFFCHEEKRLRSPCRTS